MCSAVQHSLIKVHKIETLLMCGLTLILEKKKVYGSNFLQVVVE